MDNQYQTITIALAEAEKPIMKEHSNGKWVKFGENDNYPNFLETLYGASPKHSSIINNKVKYVLGKGLKVKGEEVNQIANIFLKLHTNLSKCITVDLELNGGCYIEAVPKRNGQGWIFTHIKYSRIRSNSDNTQFYYKKNFGNWREEAKPYPAFNPDNRVPSIIYYREYRPDIDVYALPSYYAAMNYIAADAEVAKHTFTNSKKGFSATKMITFRNGEPQPLMKEQVTSQLKKDLSGENGEKIVVQYLPPSDVDISAKIDDLGVSDLSKENFSNVDDLISSNIYAAHEVTAPELMGVPSRNNMSSGEGQKLRVSYELFKNVYAQSKQAQIIELFEFFAYLNGINVSFEIVPLDPVGVQFSETLLQSILSKQELRNMIGYQEDIKVAGNQGLVAAINSLSPLVANKLLETMTKDEIRSLGGLVPIVGGSELATPDGTVSPVQIAQDNATVNTTLTNLTGRQRQNVMGIVRQFSSGKLTKAQAAILLKGGYGFTDQDVNDFLGIDDLPTTNDATKQLFESDEDVAQVFAAFGESSENFTEIVSYKATFDVDEEATLLKEVTKIKSVIPKFDVRYSYEKRPEAEGAPLLRNPDGSYRSRPFCVKMIGLNRYYTRADIQKISQILGYDVFNRTGGFWNNNGKTEIHCRHEFRSKVVVRKN
jgi:hypothetical protein